MERTPTKKPGRSGFDLHNTVAAWKKMGLVEAVREHPEVDRRKYPTELSREEKLRKFRELSPEQQLRKQIEAARMGTVKSSFLLGRKRP